MKAYPMGNEKKFDVTACKKNYDKNAKTRKERKDRKEGKVTNDINSETVICEQNGEVSMPNQMGGVKDFKYMPELDGPIAKKTWISNPPPLAELGKPTSDPIPPSDMEDDLDEMNDKIWSAAEEEKLQSKLDTVETFPANPYALKPKPIPEARQEAKPIPEARPTHGVSCDELLLTRPISSLYCPDSKAQVCYVIGGGYSSEPYVDLLRTKSEHTFGCSGVPLLFPELGHWYSCDVVKTEPMVEWLWNRSKKTIKVLAYEAYHSSGEVPNDCIVCKTPRLGPSSLPDKNGLWHGCSSTIGACEMARLMGYKAIYLFGVDYDKRTHPFDTIDPEQGKNTKEWNQERISECWQRVVNTYASFRIKILNCNENSLLVKLNIMKSVDPYKAFQGN